ncbi:MAG TPA: Bax inhibitor-1/YccA family protein, partial [Dyella sp.]|nr:Bax inhibitor-1/YccA family protein [Dyella sp.]
MRDAIFGEPSIMRSSNPVLQPKVFQGPFAVGERMTMNGTIAKTGLLLLLAVVTGSWTWHRCRSRRRRQPAGSDGRGVAVPVGGLIAGFVLAMVSSFAPRWSGITAPL